MKPLTAISKKSQNTTTVPKLYQKWSIIMPSSHNESPEADMKNQVAVRPGIIFPPDPEHTNFIVFGDFIDELRKGFDIILFEGSPVPSAAFSVMTLANGIKHEGLDGSCRLSYRHDGRQYSGEA